MKGTVRLLSLLGLCWVGGVAHGKIADSWEDLPPLPVPRQEVGVAALDGKVYVIGGILADHSATAIAERYDVESGQWERVASLPEALHHVGAAAAAGRIYALGGLDGAFRGVRGVYAFDPAAGVWERRADMPRARGAMGVAVLEERIYAAGGQDGSASTAAFAVYLAAEDRWEVLPDLPAPRNHLAAAAVRGVVYALGGRAGSLSGRVDAFDPVANTWFARSLMPTPRGGIAAAVVGEWIYVLGGEGNAADPQGIFPHVEAYDPRRDCWERRDDMPQPRHGIGAAAVEPRIFVPGGSPQQGFGVTDVHDVYTPGTPFKDSRLFLRGDANRDSAVNLPDAVFTLRALFQNGPPLPCPDAADSNDDGRLNLTDPVYTLNYLFRGGPPPRAPGPDVPGVDPTPDGLAGCGG